MTTRVVYFPERVNVDDLAGEVETVGGEVDSHLADTFDAHDATAVSVSPTGAIAATNVQAALAELDTEKSGTGHTHSADSTKIDKSTLDANSILYAVTDDTPAALAVAASRIVGRKASGDIDDMTTAELAALFGTPTGAKFLADDGTLKTPSGGSSGGVLACHAYDPASITSFNIASTTVTDIDATNMAVTFTAPASGAVLVVVSALTTHPGGSGNYLNWHLRDGSTTLGTKFMGGHSSVDNTHMCTQFKVTGLTGGNSYTFKWAQSRTGSGTATTHAGGVAGAAVMAVHALP